MSNYVLSGKPSDGTNRRVGLPVTHPSWRPGRVAPAWHERNYSSGARAPKRYRCATCGDLARWAPHDPLGTYLYWCGRDGSHALTIRSRKPRITTARKQSVGGRTNHGNDHANLATQVWVPTPYERANGARTVASRAI